MQKKNRIRMLALFLFSIGCDNTDFEKNRGATSHGKAQSVEHTAKEERLIIDDETIAGELNRMQLQNSAANPAAESKDENLKEQVNAGVPLVELEDKMFPRSSVVFRQRNRNNQAKFSFTLPGGSWNKAVGQLKVDQKNHGPEFQINAKPGKAFDQLVERGARWRLIVKLYKHNQLIRIARSATLVVGDIFLTAGQSNSTNAGDGRTASTSGGAFMFTGKGWKTAADPFVTADTTTGSSPWPYFADFYFAKTGVPVGIVSLGWSGTHIGQWQPGNSSGLAKRLADHAKVFGRNGIRGVLWHQGESDVFMGTSTKSYRAQLQNLMAHVRGAAGWNEMPWYISLTSYPGVSGWKMICNQTFGGRDCVNRINQFQLQVLQGQQTARQQTLSTFQGPNSDELWSSAYRANQNGSYIHFNTNGQWHLAWRWFEAVAKNSPPVP